MAEFDCSKYCMEQLLKKVPEITDLEGDLRQIYLDHLDYEFPLVILIYEDVLCPYFLSLINKSNKKSKDIAKRIINLIEELAEHKNIEVGNFVQVGFLERLVHDIIPRKDLEKYLSPSSLKLAKEIAWNRYGLDHRIGWKKAKEWYFPYSKYFGMIANKPIVQDAELQKIYDQVYAPEVSDYIPGGFPQMLKEEVLLDPSGTKLFSLKKSEQLLAAITERIENKDNHLSDDDLETAKVIMYNLRDSISLAKNYMTNPIKLPHTKNPIENGKNNHEEKGSVE